MVSSFSLTAPNYRKFLRVSLSDHASYVHHLIPILVNTTNTRVLVRDPHGHSLTKSHLFPSENHLFDEVQRATGHVRHNIH